MEGSHKVQIHLYDLSQGMAKQFSPMLVGKQIDGIWHTGIVVFGREYFYGGGICDDAPGRTPYGVPVKTIDLGVTEIPKELFLEFLNEINFKFSADKYDLFTNNCNNFTDECSEFLVGEKIPSYITGLPQEVLRTPLGQMLQPTITQMQQNIAQQGHHLFAPQTPTQSQNFNQQNQTASAPKGEAVFQVQTLQQFLDIIAQSQGVIVDFFSFNCGPCVRIKPTYEGLAKDYAHRCPQIRFVSVNVDLSRDIPRNFGVNAWPTFISFYNGVKVDKLVGANEMKLRSLVSAVEQRINEKNDAGKEKGENFDFDLFNPDGDSPFFFASDNFSLPISKIQELVEKDKLLSESSMKDAFNVFAQAPKQLVKQFNKEQKTYLLTWLVETLLYIGISDKVIPFLDLIRMICADPSYTDLLVSGTQTANLKTILEPITKGEKEVLELPKGLRLILLRLIVNISGSKEGAEWLEKSYDTQSKNVIDNLKFLQNEPAALTAILMLIMNLTHNIGGGKVIEQESSTLLQQVLEILTKETDEKNLLACVINLCWLAYKVKAIRPKLKQAEAFFKVEKLRTTTLDNNLAKACKDLQKIVA